MTRFGLTVPVKHVPALDPDFMPLFLFNRTFLKTADKPFSIAVERAAGQMAVYNTFVHGTPHRREADLYYLERLIKSLLWLKGGFRIYLAGNDELAAALGRVFSAQGARSFDAGFMADVYEHAFEVVSCSKVPDAVESSEAIGRHLNGCRIGFDAGGSDRKVSAVIDGEAVFSEEVVWFPKTTADPQYHYDGIVSALRTAAAKMPRVDAIGISSAGIYIENRTMKASLFLQVSQEDFDSQVKDIYLRAAQEVAPGKPVVVCNDGDVSALAGAMGLEVNNVLGIAMGTSEAVGFVDSQGNITGWLNELAFMPVDANPNAMADEWSGDIGVGCKYFSQDAVIKLAPAAGITLADQLSPAEKLKAVQALMEQGGNGAEDIYRSIGTYLGHTLPFYYHFYGFSHVLLLGRVMSGRGGDLILAEAKRVLADEYPEVADRIHPTLPDEKSRRVGQSVTAASLPKC